MAQSNGILTGSLAAFILAGAMSPTTANAWPLGRLFHLHPTANAAADNRITFQLVNKGGLVQHVKVAGRVYTLMPHGALAITAPEGTEVFAMSQGFGHRKGDLLFTVTPALKSDAVSID